MLRQWVSLTLFLSCAPLLTSCHETYSNDPKVAAGYAAVAGGLAVAEAVAAANSNPPASNRESPSASTGNELRDHVVEVINRFRAEHDIPRVTPSAPLITFAQRGSEWLQNDHQPKRHLLSDARCSRCGEVQGREDGEPAAPSQEQMDTALRAILEDPNRSAILLAPGWRFIGVGIVSPGGTMYLTIDLSEVDL